MCTKLILCEQACKDGLQGDIRSSYPELLADDNDADKQYVEAYYVGESMVCYRQASKNYTDMSCENDCREKFPECRNEIDSSSFVKAYHDYSRAFHKLGMWSFDVWWIINDKVDALLKKGASALGAVKKSVNGVVEKMSIMKESFEKSVNANANRKRREIELNVNALWNEFKINYNKTDPEMVKLTENMNWDEFKIIYTN